MAHPTAPVPLAMLQKYPYNTPTMEHTLSSPFHRTILDTLEVWSASPSRKPLILRGARQVGKTVAVHLFAARYRHYLYLNMEYPGDAEIFQQNLNVRDLLQDIRLRKKMQPE